MSAAPDHHPDCQRLLADATAQRDEALAMVARVREVRDRFSVVAFHLSVRRNAAAARDAETILAVVGELDKAMAPRVALQPEPERKDP